MYLKQQQRYPADTSRLDRGFRIQDPGSARLCVSLAPSRDPQKPRGLDSCSLHVGMHAGASVHPVQTSRSSHSVKPGNMYAAVATRNFPTTYMEANGLDARPHLHILHMLSLNTLSQNHVSMAKCPSSDPFIPFSQKNIPENIPKNIGPRTLSYYLTLAPPPPASPLFSSDKPSSPGSDFYIVQQLPKQPTSKPCLSIPSLLPLARQGSSQLGKFHIYFRLVSPPPPPPSPSTGLGTLQEPAHASLPSRGSPRISCVSGVSSSVGDSQCESQTSIPSTGLAQGRSLFQLSSHILTVLAMHHKADPLLPPCPTRDELWLTDGWASSQHHTKTHPPSSTCNSGRS